MPWYKIKVYHGTIYPLKRPKKGSQLLIIPWYKIKNHSLYHGVVFKCLGYVYYPFYFICIFKLKKKVFFLPGPSPKLATRFPVKYLERAIANLTSVLC